MAILFPKIKVFADWRLAAGAYNFNLRSSSAKLANAALYRGLGGIYFILESNELVKGLFILTNGVVDGRSKFENGSNKIIG